MQYDAYNAYYLQLIDICMQLFADELTNQNREYCKVNDNAYYHSLYSILDFDWLIHLQITACKYRSAANNWCKYCTEHAHFENASSASIKKIFLSKCQHGSFCRVIRKRINCPLY